jgi:hypothetical protein
MPRFKPLPGRILSLAACLLLFALAFLAFDRLAFWGLREAATHYYMSLSEEPLRSKKTTISGQGGDLLVFGTSRARAAFSQDALAARLSKRIVKEAAAGRYPSFFYYYYRKYRRLEPRPKGIIYGLDYFVFEKRSQTAQLARLDKSIQLDSLSPGGGTNRASPFLSRVSWLFRRKPEIDGFLSELMHLEQAAAAGETGDGPEEPRPASHPGRKRRRAAEKVLGTMRTRPAEWTRRPYRPFPGVEGEFLERLLALTEAEGVPVFLVILPDYVGTNETNFEQDNYKSDIRGLAARHRNVHFLDFNRLDKFNLNNPDLFQDGGWGRSNCHLSGRGVRIISREISPAIRRILGRNRKGPERKSRPGR